MSLSKYSSSKKRTIESERRVFQEKWEIAYFCSEIEGKITCLICGQNISVPKEYNVRRHYETHREKYDQYKEKPREDKLRDFKAALLKQQSLFRNVKRDNEAVVKASYVTAELIAKNSKFKSFTAFSIAVDESADVSGVAQLAVFIRACDTDLIITEELLYIISLVKYNLPLSKLVCEATDGAPSMTGQQNGFVAKLMAKQKEVCPSCKFHHIHCILPYYAEVRWLSCYSVLKRFWLFREEIKFKLKLKPWEGQMKNFFSYLPSQYSQMRQFAARILAIFGSTYLCEQLFSLVKTTKTTHRSRLTAEDLSSILKIASSESQVAKINSLVSRKTCQFSSTKQ
ncbi:hypothetical protein B7P43_G18458 [Cryptotermes secundus]|uniref:SPIN-DOC-like zinc-finger domain-containing protein n=1 Tax=Cryptotermes secundus TaxID=105785 RepID=A0A2J7PGI7_9NEOP|nr:hypothetical protein B7P43_G18458 [Cryptotermes secundus]